MPEALTRVPGFDLQRDRASARRRVVRTRLSVRSRLRAPVHRPSAIGAPARLMMASAPSRQCSQVPASRLFHSTAVTAEPHKRCTSSFLLVRSVTRCPSRQSETHKGRPMNPVPPVTTICKVSFPTRTTAGGSQQVVNHQPVCHSHGPFDFAHLTHRDPPVESIFFVSRQARDQGSGSSGCEV